MVDIEQAEREVTALSRQTRISYLAMAGLLVLCIWLHLATPLLAALFTYLALSRLRFIKRGGHWLAVGIFLLLLAGLAYGLGHFVRQTVRALPDIADRAIPALLEWAKRQQLELPFTDYDSLKEVARDAVTGQVEYLAGFAKAARGATKQVAFLVVGCVVGLSIFLQPRFELDRQPGVGSENLYSLVCEEIGRRFATLYRSFEVVMGAQVVISAINTVLTTIFVLAVGLPHAVVIVGVTFCAGCCRWLATW
jgi:predicted PurR-regulated permease PerM